MRSELSPDHVEYVGPVSTEGDVVARWGAIAAGMFTVLALLVLLAEVGLALGLSAYEPGDRGGPYAVGAGIWGVIAGLLAFLGGGYVAARVARHVRSRAGVEQGLLVWVVAVPIIGVLAASLAIGTVTAAGVTTIAAVQADPAAATEAREAARRALAARTESAPAATSPRPEFDRNAPAAVTVENAIKSAGATGWAAVAALLLTLGAAMVGGSLGTRRRVRVLVVGSQRTEVRGHVERLPV